MLHNNAAAASSPPVQLDPVAAFDHWFKIVSATTPALKEEAYRLRYQVYCVENSFEDPAVNPGEIEFDQYDDRSAHSLLIHRESRIVSGTVRLILANQEDLENSFPIQEVCSAELLSFGGIVDLAGSAEISRFAVSKQFRRRIGETKLADAKWDTETEGPNSRLRKLPYITLGLFRACLRMSIEHRVAHVFAVMEPALIRLIRRFGLRFQPIGPLVHYHGERQPCVADVRQLSEMAAEHRKDCWLVGTDQGRLKID